MADQRPPQWWTQPPQGQPVPLPPPPGQFAAHTGAPRRSRGTAAGVAVLAVAAVLGAAALTTVGDTTE